MKHRANHRGEAAPRDGRERTQRQLRVGEVVRHALVGILDRGELRDPALAGVSVTVSEVRVSADLRNATAFVVPLGGEGTDEVVAAFRRAAPFLRRRMAGQVDLRRLPELFFEADTTFDNVDRIGRLLETAPGAPGRMDDGNADGTANGTTDGTSDGS